MCMSKLETHRHYGEYSLMNFQFSNSCYDKGHLQKIEKWSNSVFQWQKVSDKPTLGNMDFPSLYLKYVKGDEVLRKVGVWKGTGPGGGQESGRLQL